MKLMIIKLSRICFITSLLLTSTFGYAYDSLKPFDVNKIAKKPDGFGGINLAETSDYLEECCPDKQEEFCYNVKIKNKSSTTEAYTAKLTYKLGKCPVAEITDPIGSDGLQMPPRCPVPLKYSFVSLPDITTINIDPNSNATLHIPKHTTTIHDWKSSIKDASIVIRGHGGLFSESIKLDAFKPAKAGLCFQISNGR